MRAAELDISAVPDGKELEFIMPARDIASYVNPLSSPPWFGLTEPITFAEIARAFEEGNLVFEHLGAGTSGHVLDEDLAKHDPSELRRLHIGRIAAFVHSMPEDCICIGVGMPSFGHDIGDDITIDDGNHRLAAAIYLDGEIRASFAGEWEEFQRLFPHAVYRDPAEESELPRQIL